MYKKLTKKAKILNLLTRGSKVTWTQLKNTYGLKSPRAMIDTIRRDGFCVYANKDTKGNTFYQIGKPSAAILAALGNIFSDVSELSNLNNCIPPTPSLGRIDIALTIIPIPPSH